MNWIKGFDRIFLIISIPVFLISVTSAFYNSSKFENYPFFPIGELNPAFDERSQEQKPWEKYQQIPEEEFWKKDRIVGEKYQNEIPRYLPAKAYKRFSFAVGVGLCVSAIWLGALCGTTRLIRITGRFIIGGFKKRDS